MSSEPSDDAFDDYMRAVWAIPSLTEQEERELWAAIKPGDGSITAKKRLIETNLHLVFAVAARYEGRGLSVVDLVEAGNLGLVRAVELFDPSDCSGGWPLRDTLEDS